MPLSTNVVQTLPELTLDEASSDSFLQAMALSISTSIGVPASTVTNMLVAANRRMLLSGVTASYILTIASGKTPEFFMSALQESVSSGSFATSLSANSGVQINIASGLSVVNLSPTSSPTLSPDTSSDTRGTVVEIFRSVSAYHNMTDRRWRLLSN